MEWLHHGTEDAVYNVRLKPHIAGINRSSTFQNALRGRGSKARSGEIWIPVGPGGETGPVRCRTSKAVAGIGVIGRLRGGTRDLGRDASKAAACRDVEYLNCLHDSSSKVEGQKCSGN
jgi:hypothetical protein